MEIKNPAKRQDFLFVQLFVDGVVGFVFGDDVLHLAYCLHIVKMLGDVDEFINVLGDFLIVILTNLGNTDLLMESGFGALEFVKNFFIEFLSRTETCELDLYILRTGELDHTFGKIGNLHGLAHVEDEDFTAITLRTGLEYELTSLGDEHEETYNTLVGDSDGTAVANLLPEEGNDRAVGAQHITEAGGDELGSSRRTAHLSRGDETHLVGEIRQERAESLAFDGLVEALDINLTDTF